MDTKKDYTEKTVKEIKRDSQSNDEEKRADHIDKNLSKKQQKAKSEAALAKPAIKINEENRLVKLNQDISNESKEEEKIEKTDAESAQQPEKNIEIKIANQNIHS